MARGLSAHRWRWSNGDSRDGSQGWCCRPRRDPKPSVSVGSAGKKLLTHWCLLLHRQPQVSSENWKPWPSAPSFPPCARIACPSSLLNVHLAPYQTLEALSYYSRMHTYCSNAEIQIRKKKKLSPLTYYLEKITLGPPVLHFFPDFYIIYGTGQFQLSSMNCSVLSHEEISTKSESKHLETLQQIDTAITFLFIVFYRRIGL